MNKLVDSFGRKHTYLRISVTDRCNLRCQYCMPPEGLDWKKKSEILTYEEMLRIARVFVDLGIKKIRITGGEPLVRKDLDLFIKQISELPGIQTIAMTTNGVLLADKAQALKDAGLQALNISLDTLKEDRFKEITKRDDFQNVINGINAALDHGFSPLKVNVVLIKGFNDDEILDFIDYVKERPINIRFIEYMPFKDNHWSADGVCTYADTKALIETKHKLTALSLEEGAVAKDFAIADYAGTVSFVTSMTESFCASCNRLRLTADGSMKSCLFYPAELNLRDTLRAGISDEGLAKIIQDAVWQKPEAHPPAEEILADQNRAMISIGG